jgi:2-C-methyl-D-erythritol 4-phosphate cytidylyltransferase/2-C-methyl-D-erythritol 2,4-cyclodiphosphate synthase
VSEGFAGTDDAAYFERAGGKVFILPGNGDNLKITWPEDFEKFEFMINEKNV